MALASVQGKRQLTKMGGGGAEDCHGTHACMPLHPIRGVWEHAPQEKFKFGFSEIASGAI